MDHTMTERGREIETGEGRVLTGAREAVSVLTGELKSGRELKDLDDVKFSFRGVSSPEQAKHLAATLAAIAESNVENGGSETDYAMEVGSALNKVEGMLNTSERNYGDKRATVKLSQVLNDDGEINTSWVNFDPVRRGALKALTAAGLALMISAIVPRAKAVLPPVGMKEAGNVATTEDIDIGGDKESNEYFPSLDVHPAVVEKNNNVLITREANLVMGETELIKNPSIVVNDPEGNPYDIDYVVRTKATYVDDNGKDQQVNVIIMAGLADGTTINVDTQSGLTPNGGKYDGNPDFFSGSPDDLVAWMNQHKGLQMPMYVLVAVGGRPEGTFGSESYKKQFGFWADVLNSNAQDIVKFETGGHIPPNADFTLWAMKMDFGIDE